MVTNDKIHLASIEYLFQFGTSLDTREDRVFVHGPLRFKIQVHIATPTRVIHARAEQPDPVIPTEMASERLANHQSLLFSDAHG